MYFIPTLLFGLMPNLIDEGCLSTVVNNLNHYLKPLTWGLQFYLRMKKTIKPLLITAHLL